MDMHASVNGTQPIHNTASAVSRRIRNQSLAMIIIGVVLTLLTYQYFHHGLWGKLDNYNKLPKLVLNGTTVSHNQLDLTLYRPNGPDTYGSFVEKVSISGAGASVPVQVWTPNMLSKINSAAITNAFKFQHVKTGPWGLVVPLASKATIKLPLDPTTVAALLHAGKAKVTVEDVSGVKWSYTVTLN